ncbi:hypothetical protein J6590_005023 [Homalodisca vitripennis]|nr:hypothetical protein J6590_005023 [Homalodisca vitripennis]
MPNQWIYTHNISCRVTTTMKLRPRLQLDTCPVIDDGTDYSVRLGGRDNRLDMLHGPTHIEGSLWLRRGGY